MARFVLTTSEQKPHLSISICNMFHQLQESWLDNLHHGPLLLYHLWRSRVDSDPAMSMAESTRPGTLT